MPSSWPSSDTSIASLATVRRRPAAVSTGALGTAEVRPLDMTAALGALGDGGKVTKPRQPTTQRARKPATAYILTDIPSGTG
jgi:membrane peptidoglycan carboxypeptidase